MDPITAVGFVGNVVQFVDTSAKLVGLLRQYSAAEGAPKELLAVEKRLESTVLILRTLDNATKNKLDHEQAAFGLCYDQAEELTALINGLKITPDLASSASSSRFKVGRRSKTMEKTWKAFKAMGCVQKLEKFQATLDRLLVSVSLLQHSRAQSVNHHHPFR